MTYRARRLSSVGRGKVRFGENAFCPFLSDGYRALPTKGGILRFPAPENFFICEELPW